MQAVPQCKTRRAASVNDFQLEPQKLKRVDTLLCHTVAVCKLELRKIFIFCKEQQILVGQFLTSLQVQICNLIRHKSEIGLAALQMQLIQI